MARGINKVILIGNLGNDPDVRVTPNGDCVANLSIATDESYKDKQSGQMVPKTEWHRVVMFGKVAEIARDYLKKGAKVYIEGKLETRKWQDQSGADRYSTEIKCRDMQMLDGKQEGQQNAGYGASQQQAIQSQQPAPQNSYGGTPAQQPAPMDDFDDDIPFNRIIDTLTF